MEPKYGALVLGSDLQGGGKEKHREQWPRQTSALSLVLVLGRSSLPRGWDHKAAQCITPVTTAATHAPSAVSL